MTRPQWLTNPFSPRTALLRRPAARPGPGGSASPVRDAKTGFIHHAVGFPLQYKRIWFGSPGRHDTGEHADIGLIFETTEHVTTGATLEILIPLRGELERFRGKVVMARQCQDAWEIGVWFPCRIDASRMRIVEQICHIEAYLKLRKHQDGPYNIHRERLAAEWIERHAATVPSL